MIWDDIKLITRCELLISCVLTILPPELPFFSLKIWLPWTYDSFLCACPCALPLPWASPRKRRTVCTMNLSSATRFTMTRRVLIMTMMPSWVLKKQRPLISWHQKRARKGLGKVSVLKGLLRAVPFLYKSAHFFSLLAQSPSKALLNYIFRKLITELLPLKCN